MDNRPSVGTGRVRDGADWAPRILLAAGIAATLALAADAVRAEREHRRTAERALRDYAGVAATEFVRRTGFDLGFNGYQPVSDAVRRSASAGEPRLPEGGSPYRIQSRALAARLLLWEDDRARVVEGPPASADLLEWTSGEARLVDGAADYFVTRHRVVGGHAATLVLVPLEAGRVAAFDVDLDALRPFLVRSLTRGPLLPEVVGDGTATNESLSVSFRDPAGAERLRSGPGPWPGREVEVPFGDFYRGVLEGSTVRVSLDPALIPHLLPGGLPGSRLPWLASLALLAAGVTALAFVQLRRERALARLRDDFVASVSHELRTPLAQVRLFIETVLLGRARDAAETRACLEAVHRETLRLGQLVDNVLDFSRAERGVLELALEPRRLAPLVSEVAESFRPLAAVRHVHFETRLDPEAGAAVDAAAFRQVLLNLLDNAVKYGPADDAVAICVSRSDGRVEVVVEDRGPGVPVSQRAAVFRRFERLARDRRTHATGAGIGLAVVRELVDRHGGSCRVEDRDGGGARFVVSLPAVEAIA